MTRVLGLLLAAGEGRRMGQPKALVTNDFGEPWVVAASKNLVAGGCDETWVATGAAGDTVAKLLDGEPVRVMHVPRWQSGLGATLKAGLEAAEGSDADCLLVHLVDLPDVTSSVISRMVAAASPSALVRAVYEGRPGHPVVIGRTHWKPVRSQLRGDTGATHYLRTHPTDTIECGDLATGTDVDSLGIPHPGANTDSP